MNGWEGKYMSTDTDVAARAPHLQANEASGRFFLLEAHRCFHPKKIGNGIKVVCLAILLPHLLLHKLVPIVVREAPEGQIGERKVIKQLWRDAGKYMEHSLFFHYFTSSRELLNTIDWLTSCSLIISAMKNLFTLFLGLLTACLHPPHGLSILAYHLSTLAHPYSIELHNATLKQYFYHSHPFSLINSRTIILHLPFLFLYILNYLKRELSGHFPA